MPLSGCNWGEEPEETYDTLSQYYQQSDSTKQDTRLTSFGLPYLQGGDMGPHHLRRRRPADTGCAAV